MKKPPGASPSCLVLDAMHCSIIRVRGAMLACRTRRRLSLPSLHPGVSLLPRPPSVALLSHVSLLPRPPGVALLSHVSLLSHLPSVALLSHVSLLPRLPGVALLSGGTGRPRLGWSWRGCLASAEYQR